MEKVMFNTMKEGRTYTTPVLVTNVVEKLTKTNDPYCVFTMSDGSATITANRFGDRATRIPASLENNEIFIRKICIAKIECSLYNGAISFNVKDIQATADGEYDLGNFIIKAPIDSETMFNIIVNGLEKNCTSNIKDIAINLYKQNKEKLLYWSAAKSVHHSYYGGLLYHTYRMLNHAGLVCKVYKELNHDLLLVGTALHDIGKLVELETDELGTASYSTDGNLLGHLLLGIEMINDEVRKAPDKYNPEEVRILKHMVASHHGKLEYEAIKQPAVTEAFVLWLIDMMDAKIEGCEENYANMQDNETSASIIFGLDARLYKPSF